jgi:hypothetical protein
MRGFEAIGSLHGNRYRDCLIRQIQNILATNEWTSQYTPEFFQWLAPRAVFAYITTDFQ